MPNDNFYKINKENIKQLNIKFQEDITTYLTYSLPLCIILACENNYPWIYEHFIEIYTLTNNAGQIWIDFLEDRDFYKDIADYNIIPLEKMKGVNNIIDFIIEKINYGYSIIIYVDEYYLPNKSAFMKYNNLHQIMVYGYNNENCILNTLAFNKDFEFKSEKYTYNEFEKAYEEGKNLQDDSKPWAKEETVELISVVNLDSPYLCNIEEIYNSMKNYLSRNDRYEKIRPLNIQIFGKKAKFNMEAMENIQKYLKYWKNNGEPSVDYRYIHLLYEHKTLMYNRIKYIAKHYRVDTIMKIVKDYQEIKDKYKKIKNFFLKQVLIETDYQTIYKPIKDQDVINRINTSLCSLKEKESLILKNFCNILDNDLLKSV